MMKNLYIILFLLTLCGCKKSEDGTVEVIPLAPTELKGTIISKDQLDLTWKDNSTNETGYKIERKTDSGNFTEIGALSQDITTFSDKTVSGTNNILSHNTNYTYRVYSFNKVGKSIYYSNEVTIKTINVPTVSTNSITDLSRNAAKSGGVITSDGGSAITSRGFVWDTKSNPIITLSTKTTEGTGTGVFQSLISGLTSNTKYYVRAYATNLAGTSYGEELSLTTLSFSTVIGANGRIWMDRNLGAARVATSITDTEAYGDLYQWGRGSDGHQLRASVNTHTLSTSDAPGNALFITMFYAGPGPTYDWRNPQNNNLWQGVNGINNPCPAGFRLPTETEWIAEIASWSSQNAEAAFSSSLKLPVAGLRGAAFDGSVGSNINSGVMGLYWSSSINGTGAMSIKLNRGNPTYLAKRDRYAGYSVRCIKD
jgi:uncharacterized protein (TIGR02145 family)